MNKHGHFGYSDMTEVVGIREDGSKIFDADEDSKDRWPYGNCTCEYCDTQRTIEKDIEKDKKENQNSLLRKTLNWFNAQFGTGLEELDRGTPGNPHSCVIAMTLKNHVNSNFNWNVSGTSITINTKTMLNTEAWPGLVPEVIIGDAKDNYRIRGIPVELGTHCSEIETKLEKACPTIYIDYDRVDATLDVVSSNDFPDYVKEFIQVFDEQEYEHLIESPRHQKGNE